MEGEWIEGVSDVLLLCIWYVRSVLLNNVIIV